MSDCTGWMIRITDPETGELMKRERIDYDDDQFLADQRTLANEQLVYMLHITAIEKGRVLYGTLNRLGVDYTQRRTFNSTAGVRYSDKVRHGLVSADGAVVVECAKKWGCYKRRDEVSALMEAYYN